MPDLLSATLGFYSGAALCSAVVARGAWSWWQTWQRTKLRKRKSAGETQGFLRQIEAVRLRNRAGNPARVAWQGTRTLRVCAIADEAQDCRSFFLADPAGKPLPTFQPGQYLTFELPAQDVSASTANARPLVRCYSLSDRPRPDYYRVTIKRALAPVSDENDQNVPPGKGSGYFFDHVRPGSLLEVKAPSGTFFLDPANRQPVVLIGGGIGITPVLAMLNTIVHEQPGRQVYFFAAMRSSAEHPFQHALKAVAAEHPQVKLVVCHSQPGPQEQIGKDYDHAGRLSLAIIRQTLRANNFHFYLCGSGSLMAELIPALEAWGVPEADIHYESFGPSTIQKLQQTVLPLAIPNTPAAKIRFARSDCEIPWNTAADSILTLAEQQGLRLEAGCRTGNCGACAVRLLAGQVTYAKRPGANIIAEQCLTCVATPTGDIVLDV